MPPSEQQINLCCIGDKSRLLKVEGMPIRESWPSWLLADIDEVTVYDDAYWTCPFQHPSVETLVIGFTNTDAMVAAEVYHIVDMPAGRTPLLEFPELRSITISGPLSTVVSASQLVNFIHNGVRYGTDRLATLRLVNISLKGGGDIDGDATFTPLSQLAQNIIIS
ncbi:hypothetical protein AURDEDRAFT_177507 [Auricularia subglabra TFB-10046 SS5]|uniref:Uncharacterized protein n=1 Tax=Auricularia subglabra (strain TFB-10046 / SS5) TaxID=717982 RepID=J0WM50_AURST|nr:hypothetical protein AURDEDRAFT_177507 [Auricularia subglabra TFB-10046 SS5]